MTRYVYQPYEYVPPPGLTAAEPRHAVAIVGAGPIGLAMAIDLAQKGIASVVLDDNNVVSVGSRAICWAKRTLEIFDRLGVGDRMLEKGVTWKVGRLFHGDAEVYNFDLLPEEGHKYPAFINLQQYYVEQYLIERAQAFPEFIDLRFKNNVTAHEDRGDHVVLTAETPNGPYQLEASYYLACDGAKSPTRERMGLVFEGQNFDEHFLIVDVEMAQSPFETQEPERWFWFEPPFHHGQSALLHKQPDDIYQFRCAMLDRFVHGRMIFLGDSAHVVSPFGARGGNGGIQDVDNLAWKLAAVLRGEAAESLLETYDAERRHGAAENLLNSARATHFMTPKSPVEALFRSEVLKLARDMPFARKLINSGRLSVPCSLAGQVLQSDMPGAVPPGTAMFDAPLTGPAGDTWLIGEVQGAFTLVGIGDVSLPQIDGLRRIGIDQQTADYPVFADKDGFVRKHYGDAAAYLFRPDGHVAAVFDRPDAAGVHAALARASGQQLMQEVAE